MDGKPWASFSKGHERGVCRPVLESYRRVNIEPLVSYQNLLSSVKRGMIHIS